MDVILVDMEDHEIGRMEKLAAHQQGKLHRAISLFIFNLRGELLLQKRSKDKYHSGGLWSNTCCSHPAPGEAVWDAARRRLNEEMGILIQPEFSHAFIYRAEFENGLTEYEFDHVFTGIYAHEPVPDPREAEDWKFISLDALRHDIANRPEKYSVWLKIILDDSRFSVNKRQYV
jgi:isopentenyl-diphosphate delta-isomerase